MLKAIRSDYEPALRFAILTGCRRAEIVGLEWTSVDFINRAFKVTGKGDKTRHIPMTQEVYHLLWSLKDHHKTAVFTYIAQKTRDGRVRQARYPITDAGFKTAWRRRVEPEGETIVDFRFHDTRHTAATRLVRATGNLRLAQRLLGHTDIATTTKYAHVTHEDLRAGLEAAATQSATKTPTRTRRVASND
jgi:integrase